MIPKSKTMRIGAINENSTMPWERCGFSRQCAKSSGISVAAHRHVGVGDDVYRVPEHARQKAGGKPEAHDQDHVHVGSPHAVVRGWRREVEAWSGRVADVEAGRVDVCRVSR